jgi:hypothetical protein
VVFFIIDQDSPEIMKGIIFKFVTYIIVVMVLASCVGGESDKGSSDPPQTTTSTSSYNVETLTGRTDGKGLDLVITGDGFTESNLDSFKVAVREFVSFMGNYDPLLEKQMKAWNIHRVDVISATSDLESEIDTAFEAYYNCGGYARRIICLDYDKVQSEMAKAVPQFDYILVIVNSSEYGGAGGPAATISMNAHAKAIAIHELGHTLANLGDEYTAGGLSAPATEPDNPNITINNNPATVKWRHWLGDPNVDLYEGAMYTTTGVWRPTYDSFMNNIGRPLYPVNQEAWSLALYSEVGTHYSQTPESASVTHTSGSALDFSVELSIGEDVQRVDWYVDGVLALSGSATFTCCSNKAGDYTVQAEITDVSGAIIADPNNFASSHISWNVSVN